MRLLYACILLAACPAIAGQDHVDLALTGTTDDSYSFGQYNGLYRQGSIIDAGFSWSPGSAAWTLSGRHLGLENRELQFSFSEPGRLETTVSYSEIHHQENDTGLSPFSGSSLQKLPDTWSPAARATGFDPALVTKDVDLSTRRRILSAEIGTRISDTLRLDSTAKFTEKKGDRLTAGAIYSDAANPLAAAFAAPVDERITEAEVRAMFQFGNASLAISPQAVWFDNRVDAVSWQNPYATGSDTRIDYPAGIARLSTAPDYRHLGISMTGTYRLNRAVMLVVSGMESRTEQDDGLQDFTSNPLLDVQNQRPVAKLDDPLLTRRWMVAARTRPGARSTVNITYLFRERDNTASGYTWNQVPGDGTDQPPTLFALNSLPLRQTVDRLTIEGAYRLTNRTRLTLGYEYEEQYRNQAAVTDTEIETWSFSAHAPITETFSASLKASYANKAGSTYEWSQSFFQGLATELIELIPDDQRWLNHPLLRQYHLANSEDMGIEWQANWLVSPGWQALISARYRDVDFDSSELGLTTSREHHLHFSLTRMFADGRGSAWLWADASRQARDQRGRDFGGGLNKPANRINPPLPEASDPSRDYVIHLQTDMLSAGLGADWKLSDSLGLELQYVGMDIDESHGVSTYGARDLAGPDLPTNHIRLHDLRGTLRYDYNERTSLALTWRYYRFSEENFQYDDLSVFSVDRVLWTGQQTPNVAVSLFALSMRYRFGGDQ